MVAFVGMVVPVTSVRDCRVPVVTDTCKGEPLGETVSSRLLQDDVVNAREMSAVSKLLDAILPPP